MENRLPVQVLRDRATPWVDISIIADGVQLINDITDNRLEITRTADWARAPQPAEKALAPRTLKWPSSPFALNIALTGLPLDIPGVERPVGFSAYNVAKGGGDAIVSVANPDAVNYSFVAAHEIGHLFNLTYDGEGKVIHCPDPKCIMAQHIRRDRVETPIRRRGVQGLLEKARLVEPLYQLVDEDLNDHFCTSCELQLARRSFFLLKQRNGQYVPASWR